MIALKKDAENAARAVLQQVTAGAQGTSGADATDAAIGDDAPPVSEWTAGELLQWLKKEGGLSADAIESIEAMNIDGSLWLTASEEDWQSEELGLEDADIARVMELQ